MDRWPTHCLTLLGAGCLSGRQVISMSGDGGSRHAHGGCHHPETREMPGKVIIFKNQAADLWWNWSEGLRFPRIGTDLQSPDFAKIAKARGFWIDSEDADQVEPMIAQA